MAAKKVNPNDEPSYLAKALKIIADLENNLAEHTGRLQRTIKQEKENIAALRQNQRLFEEKVLKILEGNNAHLKRVIKVNENVDETVTNVLLAIRQNEYLQAWYPAQKGQPEQKVIGKYAEEKKDV